MSTLTLPLSCSFLSWIDTNQKPEGREPIDEDIPRALCDGKGGEQWWVDLEGQVGNLHVIVLPFILSKLLVKDY